MLRLERAAARSFFSTLQQGGRKPALFVWLASCLLALGFVARPAVAAPVLAVRLETAPKVAIEVTDLSDGVFTALQKGDLAALGPTVFPVFADAADTPTPNLPPMLGTWSLVDRRLRFEPRFPLDRGMRYRAEFRPAQLPGGAAGMAPLSTSFALPAPDLTPVASVVQIYPTASVLPENQLKFYVQFSESMSRGDIYRHIHLRDSAGKEIELAFLELGEELWNPDLTRVTLFIDPGRIKRGVMPLEDVGPVFEAGKSYSLTIDAAWRDGQRRPLRASFRKDFRIGPADRTPPDNTRWTVRAPSVGTRDALRVAFDEPMDHALATRMLRVVATDGTAVDGDVTLADDDRQWSFVPVRAWAKGAYAIVVPTTIEDLAGNNIGKAFDVDVFERVDRTLTIMSVKMPFEVK